MTSSWRNDYDPRRLPVKLHWAGWETDTLRLQAAGWQLSAEQDCQRDAMRIGLQHTRHDCQGITRPCRFDYSSAIRHRDYVRGMAPLEVMIGHKAFVRDVQVARVAGGGLHDPRWQAINGDPRHGLDMFTDVPLADFCYFQPIAGDELVVPEESVGDLLARIVDMQSGARLERFREEVRIERSKRSLIVPHCQIVSLRAA